MTQQELIDQIAEDDDRDFAFALMIYGGDLAKLKDALLWLSSEEKLEVWKAGGDAPLTVSQLKAIWCDDANFLDAKRARDYVVRATDKGLRWAFRLEE